MKHYAIVIKDNDISEKSYDNLLNSSKSAGNNFQINRYNAVTPKNVKRLMIESEVIWNYPWEGETIDIASGMKKRAYKTKDRLKRMACSMSHFDLWQQCFQDQESYMILEHDAMFMKPINFDISETKFRILGLNTPLGATRRSQIYHNEIVKNFEMYQPAPYVDDDKTVPQGLAGNSAYMITPEGAEQLISLVYKYGMWPNDSIMCKQLVDKLGVTRTFYTRVQGMPSTTTQ
jgi:GR25 family glycosyltransferase involved in LPS biosynthesis